jgi:hypothetical protein
MIYTTIIRNKQLTGEIIMIAKITSTTQYGKTMQSGNINVITNGKEVVSYAHDVNSAIDWAKSYPLFEDAYITMLDNGSCMIESHWNKYSNPLESILDFEDPKMKEAEYFLQQLIITRLAGGHGITTGE